MSAGVELRVLSTAKKLTRSIPLSFAYLTESMTLFMTFSRVKPKAFIFMSLVVISSRV